MTKNASIIPEPGGGHRVVAYEELRCPACGNFLFEISDKAKIKIVCDRCKAFWRLEDGKVSMISPPKKVAGKILENIKLLLTDKK